MTGTSLQAHKISDVEDLLTTVKYLNHALFMSAADSGLTTDSTNALQALIGEIENKLLMIGDRLEEIREELK
jgi:hypothetical protein